MTDNHREQALRREGFLRAAAATLSLKKTPEQAAYEAFPDPEPDPKTVRINATDYRLLRGELQFKIYKGQWNNFNWTEQDIERLASLFPAPPLRLTPEEREVLEFCADKLLGVQRNVDILRALLDRSTP